MGAWNINSSCEKWEHGEQVSIMKYHKQESVVGNDSGMKSTRCRVAAWSRASYFAIIFVLAILISQGGCTCPDASTTTSMKILATETCNLDTPPDLSGATLTVEGELIIDFVEELVVDTLIVETTGRISANGKGFSVGAWAWRWDSRWVWG